MKVVVRQPVKEALKELSEFFTVKDVDELTKLACAAAEASPNWGPGSEFEYHMEQVYGEDAEFTFFLLVTHEGAHYELSLYDGISDENI